MKTMLMAMTACLVAGMTCGQVAFDEKRGLYDLVTVVKDGKTNVVTEANVKALRAMTPQEFSTHWDYIDAHEAVAQPGDGLETRRQWAWEFLHEGSEVMKPACNVRVLVACEGMTVYRVRVLKETVMADAVKRARAKLFAECKSFVVGNDGKNPLEALVTPVVAALNAPACQGLVEATAVLGLDITGNGVFPAFTPFPVDAIKVADAIEAAKKAVVVGVGGDNSFWQGQLLLLLGVDEYNKFVKQFNEGAK